jgi:hypothetical protein
LVVFALVFGSAMLAMALHAVVPEHHLSTDSKDVVKLGIAVIATMSALVVSLLLASANGSFDTRSREFTQMSANIILLDRLLAQYGRETKGGPRSAAQFGRRCRRSNWVVEEFPAPRICADARYLAEHIQSDPATVATK